RSTCLQAVRQPADTVPRRLSARGSANGVDRPDYGPDVPGGGHAADTRALPYMCRTGIRPGIRTCRATAWSDSRALLGRLLDDCREDVRRERKRWTTTVPFRFVRVLLESGTGRIAGRRRINPFGRVALVFNVQTQCQREDAAAVLVPWQLL